LAHRAK